MKRSRHAFWALVIVCAVVFLAGCLPPARAATYYVRADGGTPAQCNGTADAPASAAPNCAWSAPTYALPVGNDSYGGVVPKPLIKSGDTLVIGAGSYMVGFGAPGAPGSTGFAGYPQNTACYAGATYNCPIQSIPPGVDATHPTVITGDCSAPPELWGTQRDNSIFQLENTHDVKIACLNLTDHSACIYNYGPTSATGGITKCNYSTPPYGTYAMGGIYADNVTNLTLDRLDIHGFASYGVQAGRLHGQTLVNDVTIRANGWVGWNGDLGGNNDQSISDGTLTFNNLVVSWNGCGEVYPSTTIAGCWGQANGGYGDGLGTAATGGDWIFNNATFYQNTSDGLDLLYHSKGGSITINGGVFWGNIGNQIKLDGNAHISRAVVNGMCNNFAAYPVGGAGGNPNNNCRAAGTAIVMEQGAPNQVSTISHSTITGNGDTLLISSTADGYVATATNVWTFDNNIFLGQQSAWKPERNVALNWSSDGDFAGTVQYVNNIVWAVKDNECPPTSICKDPKLKNETMPAFDWTPLPGSPAIPATAGAKQ